jgi:general secretion pathway protein E
MESTFLEFLHKKQLIHDLPTRQVVEHWSHLERSGLARLWRAGDIAADDLANAAAEFYGLPRITYSNVSTSPPLHQNLSQRFLREAFVFPFDYQGTLTLAVADPTVTDALEAVRLALGQPVSLAVVSFEEIELLFEQVEINEPASRDAIGVLKEAGQDDSFTEDLEALQDLARGAPIIRAIDEILERGLQAGATDIHLEAGRESLRVRFRVDGLLRLDQTLPRHLAPAVISRVKILAGLDIAERRLPQDGRANIVIGNTEADLRVAIMPSMYGETAVLRILLKDTRLLDFGRIGLTAKDREAIEKLLAEPYGLIIVTGPTGSGKTTTLATAISVLNDPVRKIVTVEDPIEYQLTGIHQTQIKPVIGLTFASALRSFLRHDPDVIMVGEMRDRETASIGIQAALTGHLVLTTLHTNTAADAVVRLADMGIEPYLIASSLRGVLGQRLVRRLCERCRKPAPELSKAVQDLCLTRGLSFGEADGFQVAVGCSACNQTGYRGRVGIFEVVRVEERLQAIIRQQPDPRRIVDIARENGSTMMLEDGLVKAGQGLTSVEEVLRACG